MEGGDAETAHEDEENHDRVSRRDDRTAHADRGEGHPRPGSATAPPARSDQNPNAGWTSDEETVAERSSTAASV